VLEVADVHVRFPAAGSDVLALDGLNLRLGRGEFVTIIGANGAGKTTLVNVIAGAVSPNRGGVALGGRDLRKVPEHRRARESARVFANTHASICGELTIEENLMLALTRHRHRAPWRLASTRHRREEALRALERYAPALASRPRVHAKTLSSGQGQLLAIVMAVIAKPSVLLLDEHTSALDPRMSDHIMQATEEVIRREHLTTLMITHHMSIATRYGDRLVMMGAGRVVDELDTGAPERSDESALIDRFRSSVAAGVSDRMLA
jgi:putative tryptophan/tyrosine transport system ATP-binding protein